MLSVLFRKLRLVYDKCNENCAGMDPIPPEVRQQCIEDLHHRSLESELVCLPQHYCDIVVS